MVRKKSIFHPNMSHARLTITLIKKKRILPNNKKQNSWFNRQIFINIYDQTLECEESWYVLSGHTQSFNFIQFYGKIPKMHRILQTARDLIRDQIINNPEQHLCQLRPLWSMQYFSNKANCISPDQRRVFLTASFQYFCYWALALSVGHAEESNRSRFDLWRSVHCC